MSERDYGETPLLDSWRAEIGDEAVAAAISDARAKIADGSLPGFDDKRLFLDYLREPHRRSA